MSPTVFYASREKAVEVIKQSFKDMAPYYIAAKPHKRYLDVHITECHGTSRWVTAEITYDLLDIYGTFKEAIGIVKYTLIGA